jgi:glutathione synthase/RimK-type ligase-like ATP-grasp enzyme
VILIVSNSRDLGADEVVRKLRERNANYLRLDVDLLAQDTVQLNPIGPVLWHRLPNGSVREVENPQAILFRAPTHLRESSGHRYTPIELLRRHQWAAFCRSLTVFSDAFWINHPATTFLAENKPYQLAVAAACGLSVPTTFVSNHLPEQLKTQDLIALKALDTFLIRLDGLEHFFYTVPLNPRECTDEACREMPLVFQSFLDHKIDVRVTIVGERIFVAETTEVVEGDWRRQKGVVQFRCGDASVEVLTRCRELMRRLGLFYGAIDLARQADKLWFLEINPTGEWAWLDDTFGGGISTALAEALCGDRT